MRYLPLPPERRATDVETLIRAISDRRRTFFGFFGAVVVTTLGGTVATQPRYQAIAVIQLLPHAGQEVNVSQVVSTDAGYLEARDRARTQMQILLSRGVREEVVRRYNEAEADDLDASPAGLEKLLRAMSVSPREDTQLVEIGVTDADPERAARIANLVAEVYCDSNLAARTDAAREARRWLDGRAERARSALRAASADVLAFKEAHDGVDLDAKEDQVSARAAALQTALGNTTTERALLRSRIEEHERLLAKGDTALLAGMFDDPSLGTLLREQATLVTQTAELLSKYGEEHPDHKLAVAQRQRVEALVAEAVKRNVAAEKAQLQVLARQEGELRAELDRTRSERLDKDRLTDDYEELALEQERARHLHGELAERGAEVELQAESRLNDVRLLDRAIAPEKPVTPDLPLNLAVAVGVGLVGGVGSALLHDRLDDSLRTPTDVQRRLGKRCLAVVPRISGATPEERALDAFHRPEAAPAEAFRGARALLHRERVPGERSSLLVTSCHPDEGRSLVSVGLGIAFAQLGARVLLVDADRRSSALHVLLGLQRAGGVVMPGDGDALVTQRLVQPTRIEGLYVLAALPPGEAGAPASLAGERLLSWLAETWPVVIVDGPSARSPDTLALAGRVDGVVLVARHGRVRARIAAEALEQLERAGAPVEGVILDDVPWVGGRA